MSDEVRDVLEGAYKVATGQIGDSGYDLKQRLDCVHRILGTLLNKGSTDE